MPLKTPQISSLSVEYWGAEKPTGKLLIALHGLGDSAAGYRFLPDFLAQPELDYLLVNAPDDYFGGFSWFDLMGDRRAGIVRSRELLFNLMQELTAQGWQPENVSILGFSQGALMAIDLALRYPAHFAGVVAISGFVEFAEEYPQKFSAQAKSQKFLVTHGTFDPVLPMAATRPQVSALERQGISIRWREYSKDHTIDPGAEADDIRDFLRKCYRPATNSRN